jgi:hypothetical protein
MAIARKCRLVSSGPLSLRINCGLPCSASARRSTRVRRRLGKLVAVSEARHCRVKLLITPNARNRCPAAVTSLAKSRAHSWFGYRQHRPRQQSAPQMFATGALHAETETLLPRYIFRRAACLDLLVCLLGLISPSSFLRPQSYSKLDGFKRSGQPRRQQLRLSKLAAC